MPYKDSAAIAKLHALSQVVEEKFEGRNVRLKVHLPPYLRPEFAEWIIDQGDGHGNGHRNGPQSA